MPSNAAYRQIRTGFVEREKITIIAVMKPPRNPRPINGTDAGIENAVNRAVRIVIPSKIPVFSAVPSMDIVVDSSARSKPSHQGLS